MSDITFNTISAPELGSPSYGDNIQTQFKNIDDNFKQIVEGEYLKGQSGDIVMLEEIDLTSDSDICTKFYDFLKVLFYEKNKDDKENEEIVKIVKKSIGDEEDDINSSKLYMIYTLNQENGNKIYKTSLPYTFLDPWFNPVSDSVKDENLEDKSCIIIYDGDVEETKETGETEETKETGEFKSYKAFPNIYFNGDQNEFCWKINGLPTSLPARGPKGDTGYAGAVYILSVDLSDNWDPQMPQSVKVKFLIKPPKYSEFDGPITNEIATELEGQAAFVYVNYEGKQYIYISQIKTSIENNTTYAVCHLDKSCEIHQIFANQTLKDVLTAITPDADLNSIFIPISSDENNDMLAHTITTQRKDDKLDDKMNEDDANTVIISPALIKDKGRDLVSSEGYTLYNNYPTICSHTMWVRVLRTPSVITPNVILQEDNSYIRLKQWRMEPKTDNYGFENLHLYHTHVGEPGRDAGNLFVNNEEIASQNYVKNIIRDEVNKIENGIYTFLTGEISGFEEPTSYESLNTIHAIKFIPNLEFGPLIQIYNSGEVKQELYIPSKDRDTKLGIVLDLSSSKNFIYNLKFSKKFKISLHSEETVNSLSQIPFHLKVIDVNKQEFEVKVNNLCAYQFQLTNTEIIPHPGVINITKDSSAYPLDDLYTQQLICEISIDVDFNNKKSTIVFNHSDGITNSFETVATYNEELQSIS